MTQLKTLKDLFNDYDDQNLNVNGIAEFSNDVKQEAIKWIKNLEIELEPLPNLSVLGRESKDNVYHNDLASYPLKEDDLNLIRGALINWIKHFFNISEEDLK